VAEKYTYGPLVYNHFGDDDDSGNYWWNGKPIVGYENQEGIWKIPIDENGNQCLPGESILHPCCDVGRFTSHPVLGDIPEIAWCREWFEDNFLIIEDYDICRYIIRWYNNDNRHSEHWLNWKRGKSLEQMIGEIWPDVHKS
jgi:hypothetical protein